MTTATATATNENTRKKTSIDAPRGTHFFVEPDECIIIGLDTKDGPEHALYDARINRPLNSDRVANYAFYGVLKPVLVKKDGDRLVVVDGRQRVRYARAANKELAKRGEDLIRVPVIVKKGDDDDLFAMGRAANLHETSDLIDQARDAQRHIDRGHDHNETARAFGVSPSTLRNWLAMLNLAPEVQAKVTSGEIGTVAAVQLAQLPAAEQVATVAEVHTEAKANGKRVTSDALANKAREKAGKTPSGNSPKEKLAKVDTLLRKLATKWVEEGAAKADLEDYLSKIAKVVTGSSMDDLCEEVKE